MLLVTKTERKHIVLIVTEVAEGLSRPPGRALFCKSSAQILLRNKTVTLRGIYTPPPRACLFERPNMQTCQQIRSYQDSKKQRSASCLRLLLSLEQCLPEGQGQEALLCVGELPRFLSLYMDTYDSSQTSSVDRQGQEKNQS